MNPLRIMLLAHGLMLAFPLWSQEDPLAQVNLATVHYPPFYSDELPEGGPLTALIRAAFAHEGYGVNVEQLPWARAYKWASEGRYDGLFSAWYRPEREELFVFSAPLPANEVVFFKRKGEDIRFKSLADLLPYRIGVVRGYANPPEFDSLSLKLQKVTSDEQNLRKLAQSHIDLALIDRYVARFLMASNAPHLITRLEWIEPPIQVEAQYVMFSKKAPEHLRLLEAFNRGLANIKLSGDYEKILTRHGLK